MEGGVDDLTCTFFRFEQPLKASYPIWVNDLDNQTSCNFSQDKKAVCPISVTLSGMEISVNFLQTQNAPPPIFTRLVDKVIEVSSHEYPKAPSPISVTPSGRTIEVMLGLEKSPNIRNVFGKVIFFIPNPPPQYSSKSLGRISVP